VIAGIEAGAVVRSIDGGETWQGHRAGAMRDCHSLATAAGRFFEAGYGGGAMSEDGAVWRRPAGLDRRYGWAVAAVADGETWFLSSSHGVEAHSDHADAAIWRCRGGGPWERLAGGLPQPMNSMPYSLITGPEPGRLDVGFADGTVWESRDGGDTWAPLPFRLPRVERALARLDGRGRSEICLRRVRRLKAARRIWRLHRLPVVAIPTELRVPVAEYDQVPVKKCQKVPIV